MSLDLHTRQISFSTGKRPRHVSRLSTTPTLDESMEYSFKPPKTSRHGQRPTKTIKLKFTVQTRGKERVSLTGSAIELGSWDPNARIKLEQRPGQYPTWTSREITVFCPYHELNLEYSYLLEDASGEYQPEAAQRNLTVKLLFTHTFSVSVQDVLGVDSDVTEDSRNCAAILRVLPEVWNLHEHIACLQKYLVARAERASLKDYVALAHYLRFAGSVSSENDSVHLEKGLMSLITVVLRFSTPEIEPIIRDICCSMATFSLHFRGTMQRITDRAAVENAKVPLGCDAPMVLDLVTQLLNDSSKQYMARAIIINSVRRTLAKLRPKSRKPELLLLYDVWLEETEMKYMEERFEAAGGANLFSDLHKVSIILESLVLNGVSPDEIQALWSRLEAIEKETLDSADTLTECKETLLDLVDAITRWISNYANPQALNATSDLIGLRDTLSSIGAKYIHPLLPVVSKALRDVDQALELPHYVPFCKGTAVGKVVRIRSFTEVPSAYAAVIVVLLEPPTGMPLPESVRGVVLQGEQTVDSRLLASCCGRRVVLAQTSSVPSGVETCVQVNVLESGLEFL